ncbi:uncharacterized protein RCO7_14110 [Rhynchosporium graminicola]|uniref:Uncharacterized protein n=2 Tax=Rhynchosporium TaxID=38037 RepID=A0A1E1M877_RHYSE|nr:uncharacterized protein RCO7_14110 [Rhynchosporium commune]CZT45313.1 uncharacterized protein RSE6_05611 [Rhynchosporium secalis]
MAYVLSVRRRILFMDILDKAVCRMAALISEENGSDWTLSLKWHENPPNVCECPPPMLTRFRESMNGLGVQVLAADSEG